MKAQDLKNSILQLAIQGKLVAQDENDEPAEVLYAKIQAEKQKLIKEGKIKKDKPLPPITEDEIPFPIPPTWKWVRLASITSNFDNMRKPISKDKRVNTKGLYNYYGATGAIDKIDDYIFDGTFLMIGEDGGNFYTSKDNSFIANGKFWANNHVHVLSNVICNIFYIKYFLDSCNLPHMGLITGIAVPKLNQERLNSILVPLPPLEEQKRIVAKIEELEPLINQYNQAEQELSTLSDKFPEQLKKSILQYAIQGKLVAQDENDEPAEVLYAKIQAEKQKLIKEGKIKKDKPLTPITEDEIPFPIPPTWKWVRWGELSESIQYGYNAPAKKNGRIKMLRISDIQQNNVVWDTVPYCDIEEQDIETYLLKANDILFARTGGTVGKSFLVEKVDEDVIYAGYLIRTRYSRLLCPQYLKYFMESDLYWGQLRNGTIATAQPNCNGQTLSKMLLPLPPLEEQHRIVAKVTTLLESCNRLIR